MANQPYHEAVAIVAGRCRSKRERCASISLISSIPVGREKAACGGGAHNVASISAEGELIRPSARTGDSCLST